MTLNSDVAAGEHAGALNFGHVLNVADLEPSQVVLLRHTYNEEISTPSEVTPANVLHYTRRQAHGNKLGKDPAPIWLVFMAEGGRRARFFGAYENHGELSDEATDELRYFDLRASDVLSAMASRLVVEWGKDTINWAKTGKSAADYRVLQIADPQVVDFPGFDQIVLSYGALQEAVADSRYAAWQTALAAVQGVYLIADTSTGKLYVGSATGGENILQRWRAYAGDGHGGNKGLLELDAIAPGHAKHFQFSILRVFGPSTPAREVLHAEAHFKNALLSGQPLGLNHN